MSVQDKKYLTLQFQNLLYTKSGTEFQSFFEAVMEKRYPDFEKVRPYGPLGDGGNDGFFQKSGVFYQVYSPLKPREKEAEAAEKLKGDFEKLVKNWSPLYNIREYIFVFNDKFNGVSKPLYDAMGKLRQNNPGVRFELFLSSDLQKVFFELTEKDKSLLGFDLVKVTSEKLLDYCMERTRSAIRTGVVQHARQIMNLCRSSVELQKNVQNTPVFGLLEYHFFVMNEQAQSAKEALDSLLVRFPDNKDVGFEYAEFLRKTGQINKAKKIALKHIETERDQNGYRESRYMILKYAYDSESFDPATINEDDFLQDEAEQALLFKLYGILFANAGEFVRAKSLIEKGIYIAKDDIDYYLTKLEILEREFQATRSHEILEDIQKTINKTEEKFEIYGVIRPRFTAYLESMKLLVASLNGTGWQENALDSILEKSSKCIFDSFIDSILHRSIALTGVSESQIYQILSIIKDSPLQPSSELSTMLLLFALEAGTPYESVKLHLIDKEQKDILEIKNYIDNHKAKELSEFFLHSPQILYYIARCLSDDKGFSLELIDGMNISRKLDKLRAKLTIFILHHHIEDAIGVINELVTEGLLESLPVQELYSLEFFLAGQKRWNVEIQVLLAILLKVSDKLEMFETHIRLFEIALQTKNHKSIIEHGLKARELNKDLQKLSKENSRNLFQNILLACRSRLHVDRKALPLALKLLNEPDKPIDDFNLHILQAEIYLRDKRAQEALESVIEGVKKKKILSQNDYNSLFWIYVMQIAEEVDLSRNSLSSVGINCFVLFEESEDWYFFGEDCELDSIKIAPVHELYSVSIGKKPGDKVILRDEYSYSNTEKTVSKIYGYPEYLLHRITDSTHKLMSSGVGGRIIQSRISEDGTPDISLLLKYLEDVEKANERVMDVYCKNPMPLAVLAANQGDTLRAIELINKHPKAFIHCNSEEIEPASKHVANARSVIKRGRPFIIDGIAAFMLTQAHLLPKIQKLLPEMRIPQSVLDFLMSVSKDFLTTSSKQARLDYHQGQIRIKEITEDTFESERNLFRETILALECNSSNILHVSDKLKAEFLMVERIPSELCDPHILSKDRQYSLLTDDFLLGRMYEESMEYQAPNRFSSLALVKALYETNRLTFEEYLQYFEILADYKYRVLSVTINDISHAVFGEGIIKRFSPINISRTRLDLILSANYGVSHDIALGFLSNLAYSFIDDESVPLEQAKDILSQLVQSCNMLLSDLGFSRLLIYICQEKFKESKSDLVYTRRSQLSKRKLEFFILLLKNIDIPFIK